MFSYTLQDQVLHCTQMHLSRQQVAGTASHFLINDVPVIQFQEKLELLTVKTFLISLEQVQNDPISTLQHTARSLTRISVNYLHQNQITCAQKSCLDLSNLTLGADPVIPYQATIAPKDHFNVCSTDHCNNENNETKSP